MASRVHKDALLSLAGTWHAHDDSKRAVRRAMEELMRAIEEEDASAAAKIRAVLQPLYALERLSDDGLSALTRAIGHGGDCDCGCDGGERPRQRFLICQP